MKTGSRFAHILAYISLIISLNVVLPYDSLVVPF